MRGSEREKLDKLSNLKGTAAEVGNDLYASTLAALTGSNRPNSLPALAVYAHTKVAIFFVRSRLRVAQTSDSRSRRAQQAAGAEESMCEEATGQEAAASGQSRGLYISIDPG